MPGLDQAGNVLAIAPAVPISGITTKKLLGLAKQLAPVAVAGNVAQLEIELPEKGLSATISADLSKGTHVPVAIEDGRFTHSVERQIGFA